MLLHVQDAAGNVSLSYAYGSGNQKFTRLSELRDSSTRDKNQDFQVLQARQIG